MSPEFAFLLSLLLRMALTAAVVVTAAMITERSGPVLGALVSSLPISAGPAYFFLALDHDADFVAQAALTSIPINAATIFLSLVYIVLAQRRSMLVSYTAAAAVWFVLVWLARLSDMSLAAGVATNILTFAICLPLVQRFRTAKMPLVTQRWYDIPLRAALVSSVVAAVVILSGRVGPSVSGIIALIPVGFTSLILILHPRIGGPPTAALLANSLWGLIGFTLATILIEVAAPRLGSMPALSLALATTVAWNIGLWLFGRRARRDLRPS